MLELKDITKIYPAGGEDVQALKGISLQFRDSEFVAILGQSGCGKTTMLNIIGGLDQYTSGDLIINGKSTKEYKDRDWDAYRNHSVGFVFQSYNLIPHQTVLKNVELALTLSGVGKAERKARAKAALEKVGLGNQINKRPAEMSGGQMQRVAIARAIVNNPDIILADEPTGALDTETSVQVMDILKEISKDRLVIMVTHNPELAEKYATRIVRMLDGVIQSDSQPIEEAERVALLSKPSRSVRKLKGRAKMPSMSLWTSFGLSLNNLFTKKGRTTLTAFAGSIGIIGIALIFAVSQGVNNYINQVQQDTLASYPITIEAENVDMSSMMTSFMGVRKEAYDESQTHEEDRIYSSTVMYDMINSMMNAEVETNNLKAFKEYLDNGGGGISDLATIRYRYDFNFDVYTTDEDDNIVKSDVITLIQDSMGTMFGGDYSSYFNTFGSMYTAFDVWEELLGGENGNLIAQQVIDQYDLLYGHWPQSKDEVILFVSENNEVSDLMLYALGYISSDDMSDTLEKMMKGEEVEASVRSWSFDELCANNFKLILPSEYYQYDAMSGGYTDMSATSTGMDFLYHSDEIGIPLKIVGIARPDPDATSTMVTGAIGYTSALTEEAIAKTNEKPIVQRQLKNKFVDVFSALPFAVGDIPEPTEDEKKSDITAYLEDFSEHAKAETYVDAMCQPASEYVEGIVEQQMSGLTRDAIEEMIVQMYAGEMGVDAETVTSYIAQMDDDTLFSLVREAMADQITQQYQDAVRSQMSAMSDPELAAALDMTLSGSPYVQPFTMEQYIYLYDNYMPPRFSDGSCDQNLKTLGYVDPESPSSVSIYATTFADKDRIADLIKEYNNSVEEEDEIEYTDYVALLMSSVTTIINAITYVLIAFVAISLVVSSIMIGVITLISVQERTKEIGILRAIGASKRNVSSMFNAETVIIGFTSGVIGVVITYLLCIPINIILHNKTGIQTLSAVLPWYVGAALIVISFLLTLFAGIIPSRSAAKKDPVVALRTE